MKKAYFQRAFTLIEILVVIAIIGLLSSVLYANFGEARIDAKNKSLQAELKEIQLALELYKSQNGTYPAPEASCDAGSVVVYAKDSACGVDYIAGLSPDFTSELPQSSDAANASCDIVYMTDSSHASYKLLAQECHSGDAVQQDNHFANCPSSCPSTGDCVPTSAVFQTSYAVYSAGGECYEI